MLLPASASLSSSRTFDLCGVICIQSLEAFKLKVSVSDGCSLLSLGSPRIKISLVIALPPYAIGSACSRQVLVWDYVTLRRNGVKSISADPFLHDQPSCQLDTTTLCLGKVSEQAKISIDHGTLKLCKVPAAQLEICSIHDVGMTLRGAIDRFSLGPSLSVRLWQSWDTPGRAAAPSQSSQEAESDAAVDHHDGPTVTVCEVGDSELRVTVV
eukprot:642267-Hanusia_phi.AAC.3